MKIVGIDLGTSNCCISYIHENGKMEIIRDENYNTFITIPSIVNIESFDNSTNAVLVGHEVDKNHINYNKNIFHSFKRLIGHTIDDLHTTNLKEILNYDISMCNGEIVCYDSMHHMHRIPDLIYLLLRKIKSLIEEHLKDEEWSCIVTVPAYFNEKQKKITMESITMAQLPIKRLLNEPTAASYAYLYHNNILHEQEFNKKILVIDYGAGTFDLTILEIEKDNEDIDSMYCEVLGIYGDNNFGGIDITKKIYKTMFADSNEDLNVKMNVCENIKLSLSSQGDVDYYCSDLNKVFNYSYDTFLIQLKEFWQQMSITIDKVLEIAELEKVDIDDIILVGGSFKIPYFRKQIADYFNKYIDQIRVKISNIEHLLYEDIAVSLGASVYGYYSNMTKNVVLIDRIPLSIGIETQNDEITHIIERNSIIPITHTKIFTPEKYGQEFVDINIYQGESLFKKNCEHIGTFRLCNLPKNHPTIFINTTVDYNGLITISARDKRAGTYSEIKIESQTIELKDEQLEEILKQYEISIIDEQLYKKVLENFYTLVNFVDKISYQMHYNYTLELTDDAKKIIRTDLELIINRMNNEYIIKKYKINTNVIKKCIIINKLPFIAGDERELTNMQIEKYNELLITLKYYLVDRYEMYLLMEEEDMITKNQLSKLEALDDDDKNIDKNYYETKNYNDEINKKSYEDAINRIIVEKTPEDEYCMLRDELIEGINDFGLDEEGIKLLNEKLMEDVEDYADACDKLNEYCIYLINSFSINNS